MLQLKVIHALQGKKTNLDLAASKLDNLNRDFLIDFDHHRLKQIEDNRS